MNQSAQTAARGAPVAANGKGGSHLKHNAASTHHHTGSYQQQQQQLQRQQQQFDDGVQEDITGALNDAQAGLNYPSQCVEDLSAVQAELAADGEAEDEDDHQQRNLAKLQDRSGTQSRLGTADVPDSDDEQELPEDLTQDPEVTVTVTGRGFGPQYGSNVADSKYDHKSHDISQKQQSVRGSLSCTASWRVVFINGVPCMYFCSACPQCSLQSQTPASHTYLLRRCLV